MRRSRYCAVIALQHHRSGGAVINRIWQRHHPVGGNQPGLQRKRRPVGWHTPPGRQPEFSDALPYRLYLARAFHAQGPGQRRQRIEAGAMININVVETDGAMAHPDLAGTRIANLDLPPSAALQDHRTDECESLWA